MICALLYDYNLRDTTTQCKPMARRNRSGYNKQRFASLDEQCKELHLLRGTITYYRRKMKNGENYAPRAYTRLTIWCHSHNLDPIAVIECRQKLESD